MPERKKRKMNKERYKQRCDACKQEIGEGPTFWKTTIYKERFTGGELEPLTACQVATLCARMRRRKTHNRNRGEKTCVLRLRRPNQRRNKSLRRVRNENQFHQRDIVS